MKEERLRRLWYCEERLLDELNLTWHINAATMLTVAAIASAVFLVSAGISGYTRPEANLKFYPENWTTVKLARREFHCYNPTPTGYERFMSVVRLMELKMEVGVLVRIAALLPITTAIFALYCLRVQQISRNPKTGVFQQFFANMVPLSTAIHGVTVVIFVLVNCIIDAQFNHEAICWALAYASVFHMMIMIAFDICDKAVSTIDTLRFKIRVLCMLTNVAVYTVVFQNFLLFIERPKCHPYVNAAVALPEYAYIAAHLLFYVTTIFDCGDLDLRVYSDFDVDIDQKYLDCYQPNFSFEKHNTSNFKALDP